MSSLYNNAIFVSSADKMPAGEHWAIVEFGSMTIPGDERSRTAPGHGYPERQETTIEYMAFLKREDFEAEIQSRAGKRYSKAFVCLRIAARVVVEPQFKLEERS